VHSLPSTGTHGVSVMPEPSSERSEVRSPRRTCVRSPAATLSTSPPSIVPMRFLASEQSRFVSPCRRWA